MSDFPIKVPSFELPTYTVPEFKMPDIFPVKNALEVSVESNLASAFYERLVKWINDFDARLSNAEEVGVRLVSFGQTLIFRLETITYWNPSLIGFVGITDDGNPVELIQHVSQISVLLMKLPRQDTSKPKQPIGFAKEQDSNNNK